MASPQPLARDMVHRSVDISDVVTDRQGQWHREQGYLDSEAPDASMHKQVAVEVEVRKEDAPMFCGLPMKYISLVCLTLQTSAQVFVIKWARAGVASTDSPYLASTVVLFTELTKLLASFALVAREQGSIRSAFNTVYEHITKSYIDLAKVCVPAFLYTVQNNLMFFSLGKLSMAVQQVTYQLKILTTAILSVVILGKVLTPIKWLSLLLLLGGVSILQWPRGHTGTFAGATQEDFSFRSDAMLGFFAVLAACFTSGLASVWLEKLLKQSHVSIWVRNVQLALIGSVMSLFIAVSTDGAVIFENGFTHGYSSRVLCVIFNNALGGLMCAAVLKYADNILRCFSTALSIILTCTLSAVALQDFIADDLFLLGTFFALLSTFLYSIELPAGLSQWQLEPSKVATSPAPKVLSAI